MPRRARVRIAQLALIAPIALAGCGGTGLELRGTAPESSAAALTKITGCTGRSERAPTQLALRCSAPRAALTGLRWQGWGGPSATASGSLVTSTCALPMTRCTVPATVVATHLVLGARAAQYEALSVQTGSGAARVVTHFDVDDGGPTKR